MNFEKLVHDLNKTWMHYSVIGLLEFKKSSSGLYKCYSWADTGTTT